MISVTEGDDKPLKYPHMFAAAGLVVVNKIDLLPYVNFDLDTMTAHARSVNPGAEILPVSATRGDGMQTWYRNAKGRVTTNWPFPIVEYWKATREPDLSDYELLAGAAQAQRAH